VYHYVLVGVVRRFQVANNNNMKKGKNQGDENGRIIKPLLLLFPLSWISMERIEVRIFNYT